MALVLVLRKLHFWRGGLPLGEDLDWTSQGLGLVLLHGTLHGSLRLSQLVSLSLTRASSCPDSLSA